MIPRFDDCLVCEAVRPELNDKLMILGLFGICPNAEVRVRRLDLSRNALDQTPPDEFGMCSVRGSPRWEESGSPPEPLLSEMSDLRYLRIPDIIV